MMTMLLTAVLLPALAIAAPAAEVEEGFTSIFNGKDLSGWEGAPGYWSVEDGAITGQTAKSLSVTGDDDIARLKHLASGVGWDFSPTSATTQRLKQIGIKIIRCINVDLPGHFTDDGHFVVKEPNRLLASLATCRELKARPHIIIAQGVPPA